MKISKNIIIILFLSISLMMAGETLNKSRTITITLDLSAFDQAGQHIEKVGIAGARAPLTWDTGDVQKNLFDENADGLWQIKLTFSQGIYRDIPFKFVFKTNGQWQWENLPGYFNHVLYIDDSGEDAQYILKYNPENLLIEAVPEQPHLIDNYQRISGVTGERGIKEGYQYYRALQLVLGDDYKGAKAVFGRDPVHFNDPLYNDDFHWVMVRRLESQEKYDAAAKIAAAQLALVPPGERRHFWQYEVAEITFNRGDYAAAERAYNALLKEGELKEEVRENAILGLAMCLGHSGAWQEIDSGLVYLEKQYVQFKDPARRNIALLNLQNGYRHLKKYEKYSQYSKILSQTGPESRRHRAFLDYLEGQHKLREYDVILEETAEKLKQDNNDFDFTTGLKYYRALAREKKKEKSEALEAYKRVVEEADGTPYGRKAKERLEKLQGRKER